MNLRIVEITNALMDKHWSVQKQITNIVGETGWGTLGCFSSLELAEKQLSKEIYWNKKNTIIETKVVREYADRL